MYFNGDKHFVKLGFLINYDKIYKNYKTSKQCIINSKRTYNLLK